MGLLDDAIREHLDLKRRRGADPAEIARAEQEALGPVRREPEPAPEPVPDRAAPEPEPAPELEPEPAEAPAHESQHDDVVLQPTTELRIDEHHDEDEPAAHEAAHDEDVLEETPDFLQETPEHDRLWFEQRPPRDFDFDG